MGSVAPAPERVRGLVNVSVPYTAWPARPTDMFRALFGDRFFYIVYFQEVGPAEAELEADVAETLRLTLWGGSGEMFGPPPDPLPPMEGTGFLDAITRGAAVPDGLPSWLTADDLSTYTEQFSTSGFFGPLSWYRNLDADYELTKDLPPPSVPCAFIGGTLDGVIAARLDTLDEACTPTSPTTADRSSSTAPDTGPSRNVPPSSTPPSSNSSPASADRPTHVCVAVPVTRPTGSAAQTGWGVGAAQVCRRRGRTIGLRQPRPPTLPDGGQWPSRL